MIVIELMRDGVGKYIETTEESFQEQLEILVNDFINGRVDYLHIFRD